MLRNIHDRDLVNIQAEDNKYFRPTTVPTILLAWCSPRFKRELEGGWRGPYLMPNVLLTELNLFKDWLYTGRLRVEQLDD
jgi:hypothetical protein